MWGEIITAVASLIGTLIGAYAAIRKSSVLIAYRIEQIEKKVELHNNAIERIYKLETTAEVHEERLNAHDKEIEEIKHYD